MQAKYQFLLIMVVTLSGFTVSVTAVSAQSASGSFNPQNQFPVGSKIAIRSVYAIATTRPQGSFQDGSGHSHNWTQNQQNSPTYDASMTVDLRVTVDGSTIGISEGSGQVSNVDRIFMQGTATSADSQSINWHMNGLAALLNGAVVAEVSGNTLISVNGAPENVILTCLATLS